MDEAHRIAPNFFPSACGKTRLVVIPMSNREDPACRLPTVAGRQGISIFLGFWQTAAPAQRQKWSPRALSQRAPGGAFIPPTPFRLSLACPAYPELLRREGICEGTREGCSLCRRVLGGVAASAATIPAVRHTLPFARLIRAKSFGTASGARRFFGRRYHVK